jgi:hypothetical protein
MKQWIRPSPPESVSSHGSVVHAPNPTITVNIASERLFGSGSVLELPNPQCLPRVEKEPPLRASRWNEGQYPLAVDRVLNDNSEQ